MIQRNKNNTIQFLWHNSHWLLQSWNYIQATLTRWQSIKFFLFFVLFKYYMNYDWIYIVKSFFYAWRIQIHMRWWYTNKNIIFLRNILNVQETKSKGIKDKFMNFFWTFSQSQKGNSSQVLEIEWWFYLKEDFK